MKAMLCWILACLPCLGFAEEALPEVLPKGCKPWVIEGELVKLGSPKPMLLMIHNLSTMDLWITHPVTSASVDAGWSSRLQAGHWSALALREPSFDLSCIESKPGHEQQVPCVNVLAVCQWMGVTWPAEAAGSFWAAEDSALSALVASLGRRGFVVPNEA